MSDAFAGVGTKFQRWSGSAWQDIAEVRSINGPTLSRDLLRVTSTDVAPGYKQFEAGIADGGIVSLEMNFTRATYEIMHDDFELDEVNLYRIQLSDSESTPTLLSLSAWLTELFLTIASSDKITADVTLKLSGGVALNAESDMPSGAIVLADGFIQYRKYILNDYYYIDYSDDGGVSWDNRVILAADESVILINIDDSPAGYREEIRNGDYCIDEELTSTGFSGVENTDWENIYRIEG